MITTTIWSVQDPMDLSRGNQPASGDVYGKAVVTKYRSDWSPAAVLLEHAFVELGMNPVHEGKSLGIWNLIDEPGEYGIGLRYRFDERQNECHAREAVALGLRLIKERVESAYPIVAPIMYRFEGRMAELETKWQELSEELTSRDEVDEEKILDVVWEEFNCSSFSSRAEQMRDMIRDHARDVVDGRVDDIVDQVTGRIERMLIYGEIDLGIDEDALQDRISSEVMRRLSAVFSNL